MSYGILAINASGRVQIDETTPVMFPVSENPMRSADYPMDGQRITGDLIVGRPDIGTGGPFYKVNSDFFSGSFHTSPYFNNINYYLLRKFAGNVEAPTSGYGMNIKGPTSELIYTNAYRQRALIPVAVGFTPYGPLVHTYNELPRVQWPGGGATVPDLHKYYVVFANMYKTSYSPPSSEFYAQYSDNNFYYIYEWTGGTAGRLTIIAYYLFGEAIAGATDYYPVGGLPYMIMREVP